jgi:excisionase family DNA binding protein
MGIGMEWLKNLDRLMSLEEVATALHVSPHTVRSWKRSGRLTSVSICRRLLFSPQAVLDFVEAGTEAKAEKADAGL